MNQKESFPLRIPHFGQADLTVTVGAFVMSDVIKIRTKVLSRVDGF